MANNEKLDLVRQKQVELENVIVSSGEVKSLAKRMNSVGLMSDSNRDLDITGLKTPWTDKERAGEIVRILMEKPLTNPDYFEKFVNILRNDSRFKDICDVLKEENVSIPPTKRDGNQVTENVTNGSSRKRPLSPDGASVTNGSSRKRSLSPDGVGGTESMQTSKKIPKKLKGKINVEYSKLKSSIQEKLKEVDEEEFYSYIIDAFTDEGARDITKLIPETDVNEIFKVLTRHHMLGYSDISQLKGIVDRFLDDDEDLKRSIEEYNLSLDSYMATTKIIEKIRSEDIKEYTDDYDIKKADRSVTANPQKYTVSYRKKLQTKLYRHEKEGIELTMESLKYVEKFWNDFCRMFEMPLSSVLDKIMRGCVEITWFIPSGSAQRILERIHTAVGFFQRKFVSNIILEDISIYSESSGIATQKNLDEVKLLLAVQDGSLERVESLLERYLGDMNSPMTKNDTTVVMIAAQTGNTDIVSSLLKHGAEVDQLDADGWSALFYALAESHIDTVKCLLEHGANITFSTQDGGLVTSNP